MVVADGSPGGGTTSVLSLSEGLAAAGLDVTLVSAADSYARARATTLGLPTIGIDFMTRRHIPHAIATLTRAVRASSPHVVHLQGARAGVLGGIALEMPALGARRRSRRASGARTPLLAYTVRGYHFLGKPMPVRPLEARAQRWLSRRADALVWVSASDRDVAAAHGFELGRGRVIPNGIRVDDLPAPAAPATKTVAFLGRLTHPKDPHLVVRVAELLEPEGYTFVLVGGGDLEADVRRDVARRGLRSVRLTGALGRAEALDAIRTAAALILPSRWEGLPIAALEAMAMGIPPVVSRVRGNVDVVTDGVDGLVVDPRDAHAFAAALRRVCSDGELRARLANAARETVQRRYTLDRVVSAHVELYRSLAENVASPLADTSTRSAST